MSRSIKIKWAMLIMLFMLDLLITAALAYSVFVSRVMITGYDPFILNIAMVFALVGVAIWVLTGLMIYQIKTDSTMDQRLVTLERILMDRGLNSRK